jgi:transmembrane sensor
MAIRSQSINNHVAAEASAWFIEFRSGDMTAATRARFDEWLRHSPEHIQAYLEVAAGWSELPTSDPEGRMDIQALVDRARAAQDGNVIPLSSVEPPARRPRRPHRARQLAASIACAALALGAAAWLLTHRGVIYSTGIGEQRTIMLADGSTVVLNALTTVRVRISPSVREIDLLQGQALFHDIEDKSRPFIVRSDSTTIRAIGTQFDVYDRSDKTVVTVIEGEVAVAGADPAGPQLKPLGLTPVMLSAGEQVIATPRLIQKPRHASVATATAWVEKRLVFEGTPLAEVAEQFNLYSTRRLVIVDRALRPVAISGVYSSADPDVLIGFLRAQPNLVITETRREFRVSLRNGSK